MGMKNWQWPDGLEANCIASRNAKRRAVAEKKNLYEKTVYIKWCNRAYNYGSALGIRFSTKKKRILSKPISIISRKKIITKFSTT
jgi:hypothetical protein